MEALTSKRGPNNGRISSSIQAIINWIGQDEGTEYTLQLGELSKKLQENKLTIAFCGHFSAGKSTLVNTLCGTQLLPSSPIPTSANVVSIRGGEPARASVTAVRNGKVDTFEVPPQRLDEYCRNGEQVITVDIVYPAPLLGEHIVLLDTPGIDSTDDAHRLATESALHLADVVFYVMDYNHVQSEINFAFAKQLKDWGKPLYLIVNQIDKHRERELSFEQYRKSVADAFSSWHLEPSGMLFLSLRQPDHPHSQQEQLEQLLVQLAAQRGELAQYSVYASLKHLGERYVKRLEEANEPIRQKLLDEAGGEQQAAKVAGLIHTLRQRMEELGEQPQQTEKRLREEAGKTLDNANVIPAPSRDLAQSFLESCKPGFKKGLLFAGAKTEAERQHRLESFQADLAKHIQASIVWHLMDLIRKTMQAEQAAGPDFESTIAEVFAWRPDGEWLRKRVKTGAVIGSEYTMIYCRDIATEVKAQFQRIMTDYIEEVKELVKQRTAGEIEGLQQELTMLLEQSKAVSELTELRLREQQREEQLHALLPPAPEQPVLPQPSAAQVNRIGGELIGKTPNEAAAVADHQEQAIDRTIGSQSGHDAAEADFSIMTDSARKESMVQGSHHEAARTDPRAISADSDSGVLAPQRQAAGRLLAAAELLEQESALTTAVSSMRARAARLGQSRFTIALFGAFSAGKSSFANALIGSRVLPVSPNPTTAAINRIAPPTGDYKHGSARVLMKSREAMLDDLRYSLALLGEDLKGADEQQLLNRISGLSPDNIHAAGRPHYSFLKAAEAGWSVLSPRLGEEMVVEEAEYRLFVADESRSCFVREIELYYSSPLTNQGVVLVDTPGADSVNARHTGVAFNYIKNADAVLFVTYYNHAFSQADRQFLMQLGRVKDQFELDKMFFLVNAADLAASERELQDVLTHVETNLQQHGIRFPRLYPVSSLLALEGKEEGNESLLQTSGIVRFEQAFEHFTFHELGLLVVQSADQEIDRVKETLQQWANAAEMDESAREQQKLALSREQDQALIVITAARETIPTAELDKEREELLYYVLQRIQYRFNEFFAFAFNPSTLQDDGRDLKKALWTSWLELQRIVQTELSQELLATTLRITRCVDLLAAKRYEDISQKISSSFNGFQPPPYTSVESDTPQEPASWEYSGIDAKWLLARFKSPKYFFEGDGRTQLRSELEAMLSTPMQEWLKGAGDGWKQYYESMLEQAIKQSAERLQGELLSFIEGKKLSLSDRSRGQKLQELLRQLNAV